MSAPSWQTDSEEFKEFACNYKGILCARAAYARVKRSEDAAKLAKDGLYRDKFDQIKQRSSVWER